MAKERFYSQNRKIHKHNEVVSKLAEVCSEADQELISVKKNLLGYKLLSLFLLLVIIYENF